ncbi:MAG: hypothetical protein JWQ96_3187 [Segetibacter sp.]|nr:hypothetical protein [Segetibacter sp.]
MALLAQDAGKKEITPQVLQRIKADVDKLGIKFKQSISAEEITKDEIEFSVDTFKLKHIAGKRIDINYSTAGINVTIESLTAGYDKLMNKHYS